MKARIMEQPAIIYAEADAQSTIIRELPVDSEVVLGPVSRKDGAAWVSVTLHTGENGYMSGNTRIYRIQQATLLQNSVNVYSEPSKQSAIRSQYTKGTMFDLVKVVQQDNQGWVKIRRALGDEGFIEGNTKIQVISDNAAPKGKPTKAIGMKNMRIGALWFFGGIIVTVASYMMTGGSGYLITWGAVIFGAIQFFQGLMQYRNASE